MTTETMRAIVISEYGGPEVLREARLPMPSAAEGTVVVRVRAIGLNHAEGYFRSGVWGDVPKITGIECAGEVHDPGSSPFRRGQRVFALMGGLGRSIPGTYAEFVSVPASNVVPCDSSAAWELLGAIPESYATAWTFLHHNLELREGMSIVVRGGTSALGQACINLARLAGARVLATTRSQAKSEILVRLGATPLVERDDLSAEVRRVYPSGVDGVVDVIGTSTLADSLKMVRYRGRVALAGFLGGGDPIHLAPLTDLPSGVQVSFFASAFMFGQRDLPLSDVPLDVIVSQMEAGKFPAAPAHVFDFGDIVAAHRLMESGQARGKIVVRGA
jgi:NADPH:quinone reductase-like Zn-dependent oxidoreductase